MIIRTYRRQLGTVRRLVPTGKSLGLEGVSDRDVAWWNVGQLVEDEFGPQGATPEEIYQRIMAPKGLTADTTYELLTGARRNGYLANED
jgi:hypothetical protein